MVQLIDGFEDIGIDDLTNLFESAGHSEKFDFTPEEYQWLDTFLAAASAAPVLDFKILEQPQQKFNFSYKSQSPNLRGINSKKKVKTYPKVSLRCQPAIDGDVFLRCCLHQVPQFPAEQSNISPHLFWHRGDDVDVRTSEATFFPFHFQESANLLTFTFEEFVIIRTARNDWLKVLKFKMNLMKKRELGLSDEVDLDDEQILEFEQLANNQLCKPQDKVRLCFDVFQKQQDGAYSHIAGPFYSSSITNGQPPHISSVCNSSDPIRHMTEVNLLIGGMKPNNADRIIITEINDDPNIIYPWTNVITVEESMFHMENSITFKMPAYGGHQINGNSINCKVQLERWSDGSLSNTKTFVFFI